MHSFNEIVINQLQKIIEKRGSRSITQIKISPNQKYIAIVTGFEVQVFEAEKNKLVYECYKSEENSNALFSSDSVYFVFHVNPLLYGVINLTQVEHNSQIIKETRFSRTLGIDNLNQIYIIHENQLKVYSLLNCIRTISIKLSQENSYQHRQQISLIKNGLIFYFNSVQGREAITYLKTSKCISIWKKGRFSFYNIHHQNQLTIYYPYAFDKENLSIYNHATKKLMRKFQFNKNENKMHFFLIQNKNLINAFISDEKLIQFRSAITLENLNISNSAKLFISQCFEKHITLFL